MSDKVAFGQWVRQKRIGHDLTQESLAMRIGCAFETIRKIESGRRRPSRQLAILLARELGASEEELPALVELARAENDDAGHDAAALDSSTSHNGSEEQLAVALPAVRTTFIGREQEVETVSKLLTSKGKRLVTLIGPPGIGKTRLALQVAVLLSGHSNQQVIFVPMSPVSDASQVGPAIAQALGAKEVIGQSVFDTLTEQLKHRDLLLLLDNFEQIVDAARLVGDLLTECPLLKVLVTSRTALQVYGEQQFQVPSLSMPEQDKFEQGLSDVQEYESVQLFVQRAQAVATDFALTGDNAPIIAQICSHLDGLPLAIELAAARCRVLSPQAILTRLQSALSLLTKGSQDLPARQQTLRGAIDWSYELMNAEEKAQFSRMSVFVGGVTLEAIEEICSLPGEDSSETLGLVTALVEKSMLRVATDSEGENRFWMLWTLREYARERLVAGGEEESIKRRHARYYLNLAETAESHLKGPQRDIWLRRLTADANNLRAALNWCLDEQSDDKEIGIRLAGALHWFWYFNGSISEGRDCLERAIEIAEQQPATGREWLAAKAKVLNAAGRLALIQDDYTHILPRLQEAVTIWRELDDKRNLAYSLTNLGIAIAARKRDTASGGYQLVEEGVNLFREIGDKWGLAYALDFRADAILVTGGEEEDALRSKEESLMYYRELGDSWGMASLTSELGYLAVRRGDYDKARATLEEAVEMSHQVGDKVYMAHSTRSLGDVEWQAGNYERATALYKESLSISRQLGDKLGEANALRNLGHLAMDRNELREAEEQYRQGLKLVRGLGNEQTVALFVDALAGVEAVRGDAPRAVKLLGLAGAMREAHHGIVPPPDDRQYRRTLDVLHERLDNEEFTQALNEGKHLNISQALDLLHSEPYYS
ncbi:MAG: tetratricopeptide repeat protein [Chloroflexota bacterium]